MTSQRAQLPSITMEFQDADVKVALQLIAAHGGANIIMPADIKGKVSLNFRDVPWREALEAVARTAGYVIVRENTISPRETFRAMPEDSVRAELETLHFQSKYHRSADPYRAIILYYGQPRKLMCPHQLQRRPQRSLGLDSQWIDDHASLGAFHLQHFPRLVCG